MGLICRLVVLSSLFDSAALFGWSEMFELLEWFECTAWPRTLSDCGFEMEKARLLCTVCAYLGGIWVASTVMRFCELGEPVFLQCWTEDEMDCMASEVSIEANVDWDAGPLLSTTSIAGVVCGC